MKAGMLIGIICIGLILLTVFIQSLPDQNLHITACDVGQGDGIYIRFPDGRDMLIDAGPDASILECLGRHMPFWDRQIDMVVITHPELDHYGGLTDVLARFRVNRLFHTGVTNPTPEYKKLMDQVAARSIQLEVLTAGDTLTADDVKLHVLWPTRDFLSRVSDQFAQPGRSSEWKRNDTCLVIQLTYGSFDFLSNGDADSRTQAEYMHSLLANRDIEVLKVPHHGANEAISLEFLDVVKPQLAVISSGRDSRLNHPGDTTIELFAKRNVETALTRKTGDIEIMSDGTSWKRK